MDIDQPGIGHDASAPAAAREGIPLSALPGQELLAKLQALCEGTLQLFQPHTSHLQACFPCPSLPLWVVLSPAEADAAKTPPCVA